MYKKPEEIIANFNAIHEKMKPQLKLFDVTPKTQFEVKNCKLLEKFYKRQI
jgi:hypothetical protein